MRTGLPKFLVAAFALVALIFLATTVINPYGVWPKPFGGLFPLKTARVNSVRLVKAYDLFQACPNHVIIGMSTVVWGIDPTLYPVAGKTLYNGGIVGSSAIEQYYYVMRFLEQCPNITKVYIDVNPSSFSSLRTNSKDFLPDRLQGRFIAPSDLVFTSFSRSAIVASFNTAQQNENGIVGRMVYDRGDGFHRLIEATHDIYYQNFLNFLKVVFKTKNHLSSVQVAYFRELVNELKQRGVETVVFFGPIHRFMPYMNRFDGISPEESSSAYQDSLRRAVADITEFWDFNLYNNIVGEDIANSDFFIDYIHYRPRLGELLLEVLNGQRRPGLPANFGVLVSKRNIDQYLREYNKGIDEWAADYPRYAKMIEMTYARAPVQDIPDLDMQW